MSPFEKKMKIKELARIIDSKLQFHEGHKKLILTTQIEKDGKTFKVKNYDCSFCEITEA